ncbi:hypothetical protein ABB37_08470 [Leptomonas pyrrhocoris]|uniref:Uncharacterized protein n=1 Tax=Leptomonas pyrrhocoris TaxID=157538 RepID=A0A0N0VDG6_LEPPY|nr:hypothetical protein ABB37_08470 [Leptomonas pyrrhocoris]KPA75594.1 hypothetical protein ABB37_08470 [Leptomonas pyrrhocoris]|eukprot:XP_015654033.1 hypothetical protein ABB37_08470 [Leptomonas pyrrhocoris]
MTVTPWYCRYGIHGDVARHTNIDGTALYRTRERPCDCAPPPPRPVLRRPLQPRRPASATASGQRRPRGRGRTGRPPFQLPSQQDNLASAPAPTYLNQPLTFYEGGLRVVVPPITVESSGGGADDLRDSLSRLMLSSGGGAMNCLPALPSIPVVWPQPDLADLRNDVSQRNGAPTTPADAFYGRYPNTAASTLAAVPSESRVASPFAGATPPPPPTEAPTAATGVDADPPYPPSAPVPSGLCSPTRHALHARWGISFCSVCGLPLTSKATPYTPVTCPLGPHLHNQQTSSSPTTTQDDGNANADNFCMLCGTGLKSPVDAATAAAAGGTSSRPPAEPGVNQPPLQQSALHADFLTRRDMQSVDEIMAHLLDNAAMHGGRVQPPCGLPNCRLCEGVAGATDASDALERCRSGCSKQGNKWWGWGAPAMCGSPAVAIIHNHYYS